jgi:CubicO group peptidase (beta-lactamase class C family)
MVDAQGFEVAHGFFNAVLRDYARLGRLLAHDGAWEGKPIIPAQWMIDATPVRDSDGYLAQEKRLPDSATATCCGSLRERDASSRCSVPLDKVSSLIRSRSWCWSRQPSRRSTRSCLYGRRWSGSSAKG